MRINSHNGEIPRAAIARGTDRGGCGLTPEPMFIAAETAWRMLTQRDPDVNMLRATIATFSAALGGANSITVLPHTLALGLPDAFARRIARNTQLVLLEESNLEKVARSCRWRRRHRDVDAPAVRRGVDPIPGDRESRWRVRSFLNKISSRRKPALRAPHETQIL